MRVDAWAGVGVRKCAKICPMFRSIQPVFDPCTICRKRVRPRTHVRKQTRTHYRLSACARTNTNPRGACADLVAVALYMLRQPAPRAAGGSEVPERAVELRDIVPAGGGAVIAAGKLLLQVRESCTPPPLALWWPRLSASESRLQYRHHPVSTFMHTQHFVSADVSFLKSLLS